jgi:transcriptional regulator with XRE-family HTH domain
MFTITNDEQQALIQLGVRLKSLRINRNEHQTVFAARVGISVPTYRKMERGDPTVPIGYWIRALRLLNRLADTEAWLQIRPSLFEQYERAATPPARKRVRRT